MSSADRTHMLLAELTTLATELEQSRAENTTLVNGNATLRARLGEAEALAQDRQRTIGTQEAFKDSVPWEAIRCAASVVSETAYWRHSPEKLEPLFTWLDANAPKPETAE